MNYRVIWNRSALCQLAAIWNKSLNRNAVSVAANYVERMLSIDPHREGIPYGRSHRKVFVSPLSVVYSINDKDQSVTITKVL